MQSFKSLVVLSNESAAHLNILITVNTFNLLKTLYYLQHVLIGTLTTSGVINPIVSCLDQPEEHQLLSISSSVHPCICMTFVVG